MAENASSLHLFADVLARVHAICAGLVKNKASYKFGPELIDRCRMELVQRNTHSHPATAWQIARELSDRQRLGKRRREFRNLQPLGLCRQHKRRKILRLDGL